MSIVYYTLITNLHRFFVFIYMTPQVDCNEPDLRLNSQNTQQSINYP
jgi:hypothetical protein